MNQRLQLTLISLAIMFVFIALGVRRRMRPQPVRPNRILAFSALIVLIVALKSRRRTLTALAIEATPRVTSDSWQCISTICIKRP